MKQVIEQALGRHKYTVGVQGAKIRGKRVECHVAMTDVHRQGGLVFWDESVRINECVWGTLTGLVCWLVVLLPHSFPPPFAALPCHPNRGLALPGLRPQIRG